MYKNPTPTTDIIIEYNGGIVLIDRKNPPYGLAIPGGYAEYGISYEDNARKEAKEETGLELSDVELFGVYSSPDRDPRGHLASTVYTAIGHGELMAGDDASRAFVISWEQILELITRQSDWEVAFDHLDILRDYYVRKRC